jgi:hypothetical protein
MMAEGAQRMDQLFSQALAAGALARDPSLNQPPPPPLLEQPVERPVVTGPTTNSFQVQVTGKDVNVYNFAMAHLKTVPGVDSATPQLINPSGTSYILVAYHGPLSQLAAALSGRGWIVETTGGNVVKLRSASDKPPALPPPPPPPQPKPAPEPAATTPPGKQE